MHTVVKSESRQKPASRGEDPFLSHLSLWRDEGTGLQESDRDPFSLNENLQGPDIDPLSLITLPARESLK